MKNQPWFRLHSLAGILALFLANSVFGQTLTVLHNFTNTPDGALSGAGLFLSGNVLYGTTYDGGAKGYGMLFRVNTDGSSFTNLHDFPTVNNQNFNSGGADPDHALLLYSNVLYGTAENGGNGQGCLFQIGPDSSSFKVIHYFTAPPLNSDTNFDGGVPECSLVASAGYLYGTAAYGGTNGNGTVYKIQTSGNGFVNLHSFSTDGSFPGTALLLSSNTLYGNAGGGGPGGYGTVFSLNTDGSSFSLLHSFSNVDGFAPHGELILSGNTLYGTCQGGGSSNNGTLFAVNTGGSGFTNLHTFTGLTNDGSTPFAGVVLSGNALYGTASGGAFGNGIIYRVNPDGTGYTNLYNFTGGSDGSGPVGVLVLSSNTIYGMTRLGGAGGWGTAFALALPQPQLTITNSGTNLVLAWPSTPAFALQSTINPGTASVWSTNLPSPVIVGTQNLLTNPAPGTAQYYRLIAR
jgi:uncharacterized repeat protein (TIGR03803 family)